MMNDRLNQENAASFTGMNLIENPAIPEKAARIQLSDKVDLPIEFREEFDEWLLKRFGADRVVCVINGEMVTNPVNVAKLTKAK